ncbi:hypothetical protein BEWA_031450 [Theileria equi strain WA]|uniref:Serine aminopeptidase S33 domain-containing protein n=1 Tax=Theileria equi strain WA TaxID=1537102 RepID=L0AXJ4_THEEQ|nr:hypothetical protein BEWA_031450 [Theileria equi strain WA]AFZ80292.1 hypothetical protein BEWA_031450 [Theileria equi strain WA]|eukprot:XP_004829958.1 hypothetical protein BEWA_031450 [Theileria equi strain WA]
MRIQTLLLFLLFYGKVIALETAIPDAPAVFAGATLDVATPDYSTIEKYEYRLHHVKTPSYTAKPGYFIEKVVEGDATVCECFPKGAFIKVTRCYRKDLFDIIHVYTIDLNGTKNACYFLKKDGKWSSLKEEEFYDHFNALSIINHEFNDKILDISKASSDLELYVNESPKSPFAVYGTRSTCRVKKIKTKRRFGTTIWKRENDEWCTKLTFYPREGDHKLLWIVTKDPYENENILYYSKMSGSWKSVDKNGYLEDLAKAGFDKSTFDDRVTLDISNVDDKFFFIDKYQVDIVGLNRYHVLPGFRMNKVVDGKETIWESSDDRFSIHLRFNERGPDISLGALFTTNARKEHKIIYLRKMNGKWVTITKDEYYDVLSGRDSPIYTHEVDKPDIVMSSFKNKQGLRIATYASKVEKANGDVILTHGLRGHFLADFLTFDIDWNYEHYGFEIFPYGSIFDEPVTVKKVSNAERYRSYFEYKTLEGMNPLDILHRSQYRTTFVEALNRLGYNVYCYDHQSHGFSEAKTENRCHVKKFMDYIYDLLQFVSIVKRGKFGDPNEKWDENSLYKSYTTDKKTFLFGFSMGGNVILRAVQEFHKHAEGGAGLTDGVIATSCMLNIDPYLDKWYKRAVKPFLRLPAFFSPGSNAWLQSPYDVEIQFERFNDYNTDPFYYTDILTCKTGVDFFDACEHPYKDENMAHYPKNLPSLFVHSTNDNHCDIKGPRKMVNKRLKDSKVAKLVEWKGCGHHMLAVQLVPMLVPLLEKWLNEHFPETVNMKRPLQVTQKKLRNVVPKEVVTRLEGTTLDLSNPDSSLFSLADDPIHGVSHKAFVPKDGSSVVTIVDDGDTIWTSTGPKEGCTGAYLFSREGHSSLLSVYTRGAGDETFCFEKVDGAWKNVDKLKFETKLRSMKDLSAPAGEEHREEDMIC